jgi:hypothetical protein
MNPLPPLPRAGSVTLDVKGALPPQDLDQPSGSVSASAPQVGLSVVKVVGWEPDMPWDLIFHELYANTSMPLHDWNNVTMSEMLSVAMFVRVLLEQVGERHARPVSVYSSADGCLIVPTERGEACFVMMPTLDVFFFSRGDLVTMKTVGLEVGEDPDQQDEPEPRKLTPWTDLLLQALNAEQNAVAADVPDVAASTGNASSASVPPLLRARAASSLK